MSATLRELADEFSCRLHGDPDRIVTRVGTLGAAGPDAITFLANPVYRAQLATTRAGAVILAEKDREGCPTACLVHDRPYATYARVAAFLHPAPGANAGTHPSAVIATAPIVLTRTSVIREPVQRKRLPISRAGLSTSTVATTS